MLTPYENKDNEFVAWYPCALTADAAASVWRKSDSAFYVHVPFCSAICDYCGFSVAKEKNEDTERYLRAVIQEIEGYKDRLQLNQFTCGHLGGGTPSILGPNQISTLVKTLRRSLDIAECAEFTIEANPLSLSEEKCDSYQGEGINRLSLGIQSFDEQTLATMGRPHRRSDVMASLELVARKGFRNFSLDIMYGVPGQSPEDLLRDLDLVVKTGAPHISCFRLEIIPFTRLKLREGAGLLPPRLSTSELDEMDTLVHDFLCGRHGYKQYGVFNFAKPGFESLHNYIAFGAPQRDYIGFGNSSYSYINNHVYCNETDLNRYIHAIENAKSPISYAKKLTSLEAMGRFFVLGLKMLAVSKDAFRHQFGIDPEVVFGSQISQLVKAGYLSEQDDLLACTPLGLRYINNVCKEFYTGENIKHPQHIFTFIPNISQKEVAYYVRRRAELTSDHG